MENQHIKAAATFAAIVADLEQWQQELSRDMAALDELAELLRDRESWDSVIVEYIAGVVEGTGRLVDLEEEEEEA